MNDDYQKMEFITRRSAIIDGRTVQGLLFKDEEGGQGWQITSWSDGDVHDFWYSKGVLYQVSIHLAIRWSNRNLIQTFGPAEDFEKNEERIIKDAISAWDLEIAGQYC